MSTSGEIAAGLVRALSTAPGESAPFRHWRLHGVLPQGVVAEICDLPIAAPQIADTLGKRETNNATRFYFSADACAQFPVAQQVADAFQNAATVGAIAALCGRRLDGGLLRIEYCQDSDGFWLEPHTDIGAKLLTLIVYLSDPPAGESWGTDLYDSTQRYIGEAPSATNLGLLFVPGTDTWHGFRRRKISGIRRSLIVNYVKDEWRARHELAFPDRPI